MSKYFTHTDERVIQGMAKISRPATINEIAEWSGLMSWNTAKKVLDKLLKMNIVTKYKRKGREYWKFR